MSAPPVFEQADNAIITIKVVVCSIFLGILAPLVIRLWLLNVTVQPSMER